MHTKENASDYHANFLLTIVSAQQNLLPCLLRIFLAILGGRGIWGGDGAEGDEGGSIKVVREWGWGVWEWVQTIKLA